jgi:DNA-binding NarL/FixJ family response regulator
MYRAWRSRQARALFRGREPALAATSGLLPRTVSRKLLPMGIAQPAITVLLVDDHHLFRQGLRAVLESTGDVTVVGEASTGREAYEMVDLFKPNVVTVDVTLPDGDGIAAAREILRRQPESRILMLTMHGNHFYVSQSLAAGARGYALKEQLPNDIVEAVRMVARGETYVAPQLPQDLGIPATPGTRTASTAASLTNPLNSLSPRERDIFDLIVRGYTNTTMAETLKLSVKTIETHRAHINKKLRVHSTGELIRLAALHGLVAS